MLEVFIQGGSMAERGLVVLMTHGTDHELSSVGFTIAPARRASRRAATSSRTSSRA
jgi:hypothetical protein